jgi:hypothetical protein
MSLKSHTAGTWAGAVTLSSAVANGATSLAVTCTTGDTFKAGDVIGLGAVYRVNPVTRERTESANTMTVTVAADATGAASAATVQIKESAVLHRQLPEHRRAAGQRRDVDALPRHLEPRAARWASRGWRSPRKRSRSISLPLPMPKNEEVVSQRRTRRRGSRSRSSARSTRTARWINRFDVLLGFGRLHAELASMRILCA